MLLHRKESLILTTIEVIDELGIQGFTTREVAKRQGVSEGTLFRHFNTKNDLLIAVLNYYSKFDQDIMDSVKLKNLKPIDAIIYFFNSFMEYYENYPAITAITLSYDILSCDHKLADIIKSIFTNRSNFTKKLIKEAQESGEISSAIDSEMLVDIVNGICREKCLKWRFNKHSFSLKEETISTLQIVLDAFRKV